MFFSLILTKILYCDLVMHSNISSSVEGMTLKTQPNKNEIKEGNSHLTKQNLQYSIHSESRHPKWESKPG